MMCKQNKGPDFLPMQTRKIRRALSIILTSLIFHCKLARMNFFQPRSSTGKWVVLQRELGGNMDEKSVAEGIGVGYQEDPRWAKKSTPPVVGGGGGGGDFEKPPELYCILFIYMELTQGQIIHKPNKQELSSMLITHCLNVMHASVSFNKYMYMPYSLGVMAHTV